MKLNKFYTFTFSMTSTPNQEHQNSKFQTQNPILCCVSITSLQHKVTIPETDQLETLKNTKVYRVSIQTGAFGRDSESPSVECIIDVIKIIRTRSNIQFIGRHYIVIKGCNQGPKDACDYTHIAMDEVDKSLIDFSFNDLKLDIYGRYRDDTFILWLHGIDNLLILSKH